MRRAAVFAFLAALVTFCIVQDRVTAAGATRYAALQRDAIAHGGRIRVDDVMRPAIRRSVRLGLTTGGSVFAAGLILGVVITRRSRA